MTRPESDSLLYSLKLPEDLRRLSVEELEQLAFEIRAELLKIGDACGGHLASNLGVVELTLALHSVFESPKDAFIFDTSHQTYVHKMLTGRLDQMYTIRQYHGLSGFAKITESPHDIFGAGHASTALSAALGVARGKRVLNEAGTVVAIIGDASLSGGMAFEALNNIESADRNFVCILNDNNMSISEPIGSMSAYITRVRTSAAYNAAKAKFERIMNRIPRVGVPLRRKIEKTVDRFRDILIETKFGVIFEEFGFKYLGPIDGHNIAMVMAAIRYAKHYPGPIMIHIVTVKGKGHTLAEENPIDYHGVKPKEKKKPATTVSAPLPTYTQVFGDHAMEMAKKNPAIVVITPAMREGSGLVKYAKAFPDRYYDVGIAEEHAVTFAAGLTRSGVRPVLAIYSTFLQRGYDQLIHDVCLQNLPVMFALDRAGLVGEDGATHHGVFDFAFMLHIPNLVVLAPKDAPEFRAMLDWMVDCPSPVSIRYPKVTAPILQEKPAPIELGKGEVIFESADSDTHPQIAFLAIGSMVEISLAAARMLDEQGIRVAVINLRFAKPLDTELVSAYAHRYAQVVVVEEGSEIGGLFGFILRSLTHSGLPLSKFCQCAVPDVFVDHGKVDELRDEVGLTAEKIVLKIRASLVKDASFSHIQVCYSPRKTK